MEMLKFEAKFASIALNTSTQSSHLTQDTDVILQEIQEVNGLVHDLQDNGFILLPRHRKTLLLYQQIKSMMMGRDDVTILPSNILEFLRQWKLTLVHCGQSLKYLE